MSNYLLSGQSWAGSTVTWYFGGLNGYRTEILEAFARWDLEIDLDFTEASSAAAADIVLDFSYLDGAYGTVGLTSYSYSLPSNNFTGNTTITFDSGDTWTWSAAADSYVLGNTTITLYEVALHEIGHAIGLDHPTNNATVMYYSANGSATDLTADDIAGAQSIYGAETTPVGTNDTMIGNIANNIFDGAGGNDSLLGSLGNDTLFGGAGDDVLTGDYTEHFMQIAKFAPSTVFGNDTLNGGAGNDSLTGGYGTDTFIFADGFGTDVITDFHKIDFINLAAVSAITNYTDLINNHITASGNNLIISDGANSITIEDYALTALSSDDFVF